MYVCICIVYVYARPTNQSVIQPTDYYRLDLIELSACSNMRSSFHRQAAKESSVGPEEELRKKNETLQCIPYEMLDEYFRFQQT